MPRVDHACAFASAPLIPCACALPSPLPLTEEVFVWPAKEIVPLPVTFLPEPATAPAAPRSGLARSDSFLKFLSGPPEAAMLPI